MNKKRIIFSIIAFLCALIVTLIVTFPLSAVASKIIADTVEKNKIDMRYDNINITFFGADASNIQTGPLTIKSIKLDYNPIGLFFKRVAFDVQSPAFMVTGKLSGSDLTADIKASVAGIAQIAGMTGSGIAGMTGSGSVSGKIQYNLNDEKGSINLSSPNKVTFNHPLMPVAVDSLQGQADINKNKLTIKNLSAKGANSLNVTGYIDLNKQKIDTSVLNINGEASMGNYPLKFSLTGPARAAKFSLK